MPTHSHTQGFTIVETLVAITVLMIAIAGPLSVASRGLNAAVTARDQMTASFLAQESMEVIKNMRDNNVSAYDLDGVTSWLAGYSNCTPKSSPCDANMIDSSPVVSGQQTYALKLSDNGYSHGSTGTATIFSRYFYLTEPNSSNACQSGDIECTLTVVVDWNEGSVPYEVSASSELFNNLR